MTRAAEPSLHDLDDDELRREAARRGLVVGASLRRERLLELLSDVDDEAPEVDDVPTRSVESDHFVTATMAELLARQGHRDEAILLCRQILETSPADARARRLLDRLAGPPVEPSTAQDSRAELTEVVLGRVDGRWAVRWTLEAGFDRRAQARAGRGARRILRLVDVSVGAGRVARRHRDVVDIERSGTASIEPDGDDGLCTVAVGWLGASGAFLSVAHSPAVWASDCR